MIYYYMAAVAPHGVGDAFVQVRHGCVPVDEPEDWAQAEELATIIETQDGAEVRTVKVGTLEELLEELLRVRGAGEEDLAMDLRRRLSARGWPWTQEEAKAEEDEEEGPLGPIYTDFGWPDELGGQAPNL